MKLLKKHIFPRQVVVFACGLLVLGATTYDVHRTIKNNEEPPSREQIQALQDYLHSKRHPPSHP
ncbi:unnamed protein product [Musa acuminata subsp. malaccensis]|uniref:(wild Malaysian banana) hypothetical protein n=1 Tax=Musa acuminata subsp. malaccensis TaxID=214687 RepID=A0A804KLY3_MUSAM|nr:unnamed protein product [Musa acuminata subsp. malaccensis]